MTTTPAPIPTEAELADIATAVAADGPAAHEPSLRRLAAAVAAVVRPTPRTDIAVATMLDRSAAPVLRSRAFSLVSAALVAEPPATTSSARDLAA